MDFGFHFPDFSPYLKKVQPNGIELSGGKFGTEESFFPECMQYDIGCTVEHQAKRVSHKAVAGCPAAFEGELVILDEILHLAATAVHCLIDE